MVWWIKFTRSIIYLLQQIKDSYYLRELQPENCNVYCRYWKFCRKKTDIENDMEIRYSKNGEEESCLMCIQHQYAIGMSRCIKQILDN